jgi:predicted nucleic acid-binding protein
MRIILDSNIYVADFRMKGIAFSNLFDFVRKTQSTIILPRIVREEVVHRYIERFVAQVRETAKAWKPFRYLMLSHDPGEFHKPDLKYQIRELRKRLRVPAKDVTIQHSPDMPGVDLNAVALRGIKRIPPASADGEELRDVIIWLYVLSSSAGSDTATAFVSGDAGFWDGDSLRSQIQKDIQTSGGNVAVYRDIDSFIRANSPRQSRLTAESANRLIPVSLFSDSILSASADSLKRAARSSLNYDVFGGYGKDVSVLKPEPVESRFLEGTVYEVDTGISFVEGSYEYKSKALLELIPVAARNTSTGFFGSPGITPVELQSLHLGLFGSLGSATENPLAGEHVYRLHPSHPLLSGLEKTASRTERRKEVMTIGRASVSVRIVDGVVTEKALEEFVLTEVDIAEKQLHVAEVNGRLGPWLRLTEKQEPISSETEQTTTK